MSSTNRTEWRDPFDYLDWREVGGELCLVECAHDAHRRTLSTGRQDLNLDAAADKALVGASLVTVEQIAAASDAELLAIPGIGEKRLREIRAAVNLYYAWRPGR